LYHQVGLFQKLLSEYSVIAEEIDSFTEKENIELIKRLLELQHSNCYDTDAIKNVARIQGVLTKILVEKPLFDDKTNKKDFLKIYGERIVEIKKEKDRKKLLLDALDVDITEIINAFYSDEIKKFIVQVEKSFAPRIIGHLGSNVRTAEKIIKNKIQIEVV